MFASSSDAELLEKRMQKTQPQQIDALNQEVRDIWNQNASFWDERMGEGNAFHRTLIEPTQERLLNVRAGQRILDVACGNGQFARRLAGLGAHVLGVDISERMIEHARERTADPTERIEFRTLDCTHIDALMTLGEKQFDAAVC